MEFFVSVYGQITSQPTRQTDYNDQPVKSLSSRDGATKNSNSGRSPSHGNPQNKRTTETEVQPVTAAHGERLKLEEDIETHVLASIE